MITSSILCYVDDKQKSLMAAHATNESNYISTIENVTIIKSSNKEHVFANHGKSIYGFFQQQIYNLGKTGVNLNLLTEITGIMLIMGIVAASIASMLNDNMLPGEFIALLTLTNNVIPAGAALAFANIQLQSARVAFERTYEISSGECEYGASPEIVRFSMNELEKHSLLPFFEQFPDGLATMIEERGLNISGGQKKLIGLARALCQKPQLLLSDELTSSSDRNMENFFIELFLKIKHKIPVLQITHNLKAARISDEILIMEHGKITSNGT